MLAPRHLPTYLEAVNFENGLEKHHKKLVQIQNGQKKKLFEEKDNGPTAGRDKVIKFHNSEKALAIEKDNELLLGKLVEISRKRKGHLFPLTEPTNLPKSLNSNARKKEKDRIAAENEAFARRLLSQQPSFNRKKLDDDFGRHEERVRLMQKRVMVGSSKLKLPPIQYSKYEDEVPKKSQSGKEKRNINKELEKKKRRKSHKIDEKEEIDEENREQETQQKEKDAQQLKELQEQFRQEEEKEKKQQEEKEKEEAEKKAKAAQEEQEKAEKLKKEEEEKKQEAAAQSPTQTQTQTQSQNQGQNQAQSQGQNQTQTQGQNQGQNQGQTQTQNQGQTQTGPR